MTVVHVDTAQTYDKTAFAENARDVELMALIAVVQSVMLVETTLSKDASVLPVRNALSNPICVNVAWDVENQLIHKQDVTAVQTAGWLKLAQESADAVLNAVNQDAFAVRNVKRQSVHVALSAQELVHAKYAEPVR